MLGLGLVLAAAACGAAASWTPPAGPAPPSVPLPRFTHVLVVVFENHERGAIADSPDAPTFRALAHRYARLTRYDAVTHPSLPNYLALVSGSTQGITSDCTDCLVAGRSLADTLEAAGRTWKTYAEGLPAPGFVGAFAGRYAKKHDPFLYFRRVIGSTARRNRVVPFEELGRDVARGHLPDFALVVPDVCHDMHDCSVATGDEWLRSQIVPLLRSPALTGGVVFVVFDEGTSDEGGGGRVEALALGPTVRRGSVFAGSTNHYGLLRTIEDAWGLPRLGLSARARPIGRIWKKGEGPQDSSASRGTHVGRCWQRSPERSRRATRPTGTVRGSRRSPSPWPSASAGTGNGWPLCASAHRCTTSAR